MMKYYVIAVLIIYSFAISEQDTSEVYMIKNWTNLELSLVWVKILSLMISLMACS